MYLNLNTLSIAVADAYHKAKAMGVDPSDVGVTINTEDNDFEITETDLFENDDEETYREHLRCGGKRELSFVIEAE